MMTALRAPHRAQNVVQATGIAKAFAISSWSSAIALGRIVDKNHRCALNCQPMTIPATFAYVIPGRGSERPWTA